MSAMIQSTQFSWILRVIIHCATRLSVASPASMYGNDTPRSVDMYRPHTIQNTIAIDPDTIHARGVARDTCRRLRCAPPCSHSYQP